MLNVLFLIDNRMLFPSVRMVDIIPGLIRNNFENSSKKNTFGK